MRAQQAVVAADEIDLVRGSQAAGQVGSIGFLVEPGMEAADEGQPLFLQHALDASDMQRLVKDAQDDFSLRLGV